MGRYVEHLHFNYAIVQVKFSGVSTYSVLQKDTVFFGLVDSAK